MVDENDIHTSKNTINPFLAAGLVGAFVANSAIFLSLPPVVRGKGAPFLPTFKKSLDSMFLHIREDSKVAEKIRSGQRIRFMDLGSGDGRVVFRAAREGIFRECLGYEINPEIHR
mmetsp:Transcript_2266/g.3175  ORF Transcript_2266/g.3175 Transcript_2266/m.3175 type:complete len:115 (-) Transcript_2266:174-518(-)